jgi:purine-nucleoside phosphorylase
MKKNIDVVDMECSAFFSASSYTGLKAMALFYVSDIIKEKPFYKTLKPALKTKLSAAIEKSINLLEAFFLAR